MFSRYFRLKSHWTIEADIADVAAILSRPEDFPRWWGSVYRQAEILIEGRPDGIGREVAVRSRGFLPYELNWMAKFIVSEMPRRWIVEARGDLKGIGIWTLTQRGSQTLIEFDWRVMAERPLFRLMAPVLKPLMAANHRWAMAKGLEGLTAELAEKKGWRVMADEAKSLGPMRPKALHPSPQGLLVNQGS